MCIRDRYYSQRMRGMGSILILQKKILRVAFTPHEVRSIICTNVKYPLNFVKSSGKSQPQATASFNSVRKFTSLVKYVRNPQLKINGKFLESYSKSYYSDNEVNTFKHCPYVNLSLIHI